MTRSMRMFDDRTMKLDQKSKVKSHDEINREHPLGGQAFDPSRTDPHEEYVRWSQIKSCCDSNLDCRDTEFLADDGSVLADKFKPEDLCVDLEQVHLMKLSRWCEIYCV